jgi:hypothetical protein
MLSLVCGGLVASGYAIPPPAGVLPVELRDLLEDLAIVAALVAESEAGAADSRVRRN